MSGRRSRRDSQIPLGPVAALALVVAGCADAPARPETSDIVGPVWVAEGIAGAGVIDNSQVTLRLDADGQLAGSGGCNRYGGSYALDRATLRFGPLAATKMACAEALMDQEQRYFEVLAGVERFAVTADGALVLTTPEGKEIRLRRE